MKTVSSLISHISRHKDSYIVRRKKHFFVRNKKSKRNNRRQ